MNTVLSPSKTTHHGLLICALSLLTASLATGAPKSSLPEIGIATYTFRNFTVAEAIQKTKEVGASVIEFHLWQKLSPAHSNQQFNVNTLGADQDWLKGRLVEAGIKPVNAHTQNPAAGTDPEVHWRKAFTMAKRLGLRALTGEPPGDQLDLVEKLVKEFDIQFCYHNHPKDPKKPDYKNWDPALVLSLLKNRDPRMGVSLDTGHLGRSGLDAVKATRLLQGHILSVHLKDAKEATPESIDVPYGQGVSNIKGVLAELKRQKYTSYLAVEYEQISEHTMDDVKYCIQFMRDNWK
ncbi:MAG: sugar phosphate isomerase/epimerase [Verrucomicrobiota bacterium]